MDSPDFPPVGTPSRCEVCGEAILVARQPRGWIHEDTGQYAGKAGSPRHVAQPQHYDSERKREQFDG